MTSPYLDLPKRTIDEAVADRFSHPSVVAARDRNRARVAHLSLEKAKRMQAAAIANNVAITTPERSLILHGAWIFAVSIGSVMAAMTLLLWVLVTSARYLLG